jgi:uncharacterized damage-inducible protein DinB
LVWQAARVTEKASSDERARQLLHHVHEVQWAYLQLWRDEPVAIPDLDSFSDLTSIQHWGQEYHVDLARFLKELEQRGLGREIEFPWAEQMRERFGQVHSTTLRQSILQVALHSTYHRGQINTRIRELGGEPPLTDFVVWIWAGQPRAEWPEAADLDRVDEVG